jgi:glycine/serine hydroxymethyltransferase
LKEAEMLQIGDWIDRVLTSRTAAEISAVRQEVRQLCAAFPLYPEMARDKEFAA